MSVLSEHDSKKIRFLGFVGALLVMTVHAYNLNIYKVDPRGGIFSAIVWFLEKFISHGLAMVAVPLFFLFSSFLFFYHVKPTKQWFAMKYKKRFHSLVIPYVFWNAVGYLIFLLPLFVPPLRGVYGSYIHEITVPDLLSALLLHKYNVVFWFIQNLLLFVIFSPAVYFVLKNRKIGAAVTGVFLLCWILGLPSIPVVEFSFTCGAYCTLGAYTAIHYDFFQEKKVKKLTSSQTFLVVGLWFAMIVLAMHLNSKVFSQLTAMVGIAAVWFFCDLYIDRIPEKDFFGESFMIYALHPFLLESLERVILRIFGRSPAMALLDYVAAPCIILGLIYLIVTVLRKFLPGFYRVISGGRA